jgi:hypothetical protein
MAPHSPYLCPQYPEAVRRSSLSGPCDALQQAPHPGQDSTPHPGEEQGVASEVWQDIVRQLAVS